MTRPFAAFLAAGLLITSLLAACGPAGPTPRPTHTRLPPLAASPTIDPVLPSYDPFSQPGQNIPDAAAVPNGMDVAGAETLSSVLPIPGEEPFEATASSDGLRLKGMLYRADNQPAPAVLLLHGAGGRKEDWGIFVTPLQEAGYTVLALDQRGAGVTGGTVDWTLARQDALDVLAALGTTDGVDGRRLAVIGADVGATLGLVACAATPDCGAAILLSPGLVTQGITAEGAITQMGERPVYLIAARDDSASAQSAQALDQLAEGSHDMLIFDGGGHGASLFLVYPDLAESLLRWLGVNL